MFIIPSTISKAIHKTLIKVNEQGTSAAAVKLIGFTNTPVLLPLKITIDHPFLYLIVEKQTGSVLFIGKVDNPALH
jgi:serpin B